MIKEICDIALRYKATGVRDTEMLEKAVKLLEDNKLPELSQFVEVLKRNKEYIEGWLLWSMDKRWTPAWYFTDDDNQFVVGYFSRENGRQKEIAYTDKNEACANFILKEIEDYKGILKSEGTGK